MIIQLYSFLRYRNKLYFCQRSNNKVVLCINLKTRCSVRLFKMMFLLWNSNTTGAIIGAGIAFPFGAPRFLWIRLTQSLVFFVLYSVDHCLFVVLFVLAILLFALRLTASD